ncbi:MAG TPA: OmpH family outer membrane protein [Nevskiaceae bacterium]|nr:OmpH family outer membrane protein [Nevskiaceae bacterium]
MFAVGTASAADLKIAVVDSGELVQNSPQYATAQAQMKSEFEKRHDALEGKEKKLAQDIQTFQKNADVMTPDDRVKKQNELMTRRNDLKFQESKFQRDFQTRDQQLTKNLMDSIKKVITQVAKKDGYSLVLQDPVYAVPSMDITQQVLAQLKSQGGK